MHAYMYACYIKGCNILKVKNSQESKELNVIVAETLESSKRSLVWFGLNLKRGFILERSYLTC